MIDSLSNSCFSPSFDSSPGSVNKSVHLGYNSLSAKIHISPNQVNLVLPNFLLGFPNSHEIVDLRNGIITRQVTRRWAISEHFNKQFI